jgi:hypothetical protein
VHDDRADQHPAEQRMGSTEKRITPIGKKWLKYCRQITKPVSSSADRHR